ncbi:MAG TPA: hypothetical protein VHV26_14490, partial [Rhizomicrobium sp.]|nr:hypothetical protein [Rhizomicrobium sp.]
KIRQSLSHETSWQHIGDNPQADVLTARQEDIAAEEFPDARLTRYERSARGKEKFAPLWRSQLAGAMRLARLANPETDARQRAIWESGTQIVGPLLLGFVLWCLEEARARGLRRLYFVARDGQILHQLAQSIARTRKLDVECRYLYGSRQAWHPAAIERFTPDDFEWVLPRTKRLTIDQIFRRLGLEPHDFADLLADAGFPAATWDQPLDRSPQELAGLMLEPRLVAAIEGQARVRRILALEYLTQEGLLEDVPFAIVDIGWYGNLQKSLARLLSLSIRPAGTKLTGFYFGLHQMYKFNDEQTLVGYMNQDQPLLSHFKKQSPIIFELFTAADHGSVLGYQEKNGQIEPVLAAQQNQRALDWGLATLQAAIRQFTTCWLGNMPAADRSLDDYRRVSYQLFRAFYDQPSIEEAKSWGSFPFSEEQVEQTFQQIVPDWSAWETVRAIADHHRRPAGWWAEGTQAVRPNLLLWLYLRWRRLRSARLAS